MWREVDIGREAVMGTGKGRGGGGGGEGSRRGPQNRGGEGRGEEEGGLGGLLFREDKSRSHSE